MKLNFVKILVLSLLFGVNVCLGRKKTQPPNIIFFMADDLGWYDISAHGSEIQTPHIDELMADGVELQQYYAAPICGPSRMQLMSGKYLTTLQRQHAQPSPCQPSGLPLTVETIGDRLREFGYKNHILGKWHQGFYENDALPTNRGFDAFYGSLHGGTDHYAHTRAFRGTQYLDWYNNTTPNDAEDGFYDTHSLNDKAIKIIEDHADSQTDDSLFLYVSFIAPHTPLQAPDSYIDPYRGTISDPDRLVYAGMVSALDEAVGNITAKLKSEGLYDNSVIVFVSDNGGNARAGASNWPYRGNKGTYYEGGVKVVGTVSGNLIPKKQKGTISDKLMHVTDWMPTLYYLASSGQTLTDTDGENQWDMISKGSAGARKKIIFNIDPMEVLNGTSSSSIFDTRQLSVLRYGNYKLMTGNHDWKDIIPHPVEDAQAYSSYVRTTSTVPDLQLFNIKKDPTESNDLSSKRPGLVNKLLRELSNHADTAGEPYYPPMNRNCNPANFNGVWSPYQ